MPSAYVLASSSLAILTNAKFVMSTTEQTHKNLKLMKMKETAGGNASIYCCGIANNRQ